MTVFADTLYWVAIANPHDSWHTAAAVARKALGNVRIVTTEEVLAEFLTALASGGPFLRRRAAAVVRSILSDPRIRVVHQSHVTFQAGMDMYDARSDKSYSHTDCVSMSTMEKHGISAVLTHDHHFTQEGFTVLIVR